MPELDKLNSDFAIADALAFVAGNGGLTKAVITTAEASAEIYLHGAHVTQYRPINQPPVLFMSGKSNFAAGKAIRGGVPICFPWFGNLEGHPEAPAHGFARTSEWQVAKTEKTASGAVKIVLKGGGTAGTDYQGLSATYTVTVGSMLKLDLEIHSAAQQPTRFEEALHSYFHVGDVKQVSVTGLGDTAYLDKLQGNREITEGDQPIRITGETDRIYLDTTSTCQITDPVLKRKITIHKTGSNTTVLWNPWIAKAKAMADFGNDEWPDMLCIETCNVGKFAVTLQPNQTHIMTAEITAVATA